MSVSAVMLQLEGLKQDLDSMTDQFVRIVKASRINVEVSTGTGTSTTDFLAVLVENLVARGSSALDKVATLHTVNHRALTIGNSDMHVYAKMSGTQKRLQALTKSAMRNSLSLQTAAPV